MNLPSIKHDWIGHQQWVNVPFYIKPIFDTTLSQIHTFYHYERDRYGLAYGLLGEWNSNNGLEALEMHMVKSRFVQLVNSPKAPNAIVMELYDVIGKLPQISDVSFALWVVDTEENRLTIVSKNFKHAFIKTEDEKNGRLRVLTDSNQTLKVHQEKLSLLKHLVLPTNTYNVQSLEKFVAKSNEVGQVDAFILAELFHQSYESSSPSSAVSPHALILDFKSFGIVKPYTIGELEDRQCILEDILRDLPEGYDPFDIQLVFSELVINAFKHGEQHHRKRPISIIVSYTETHCFIEVYDLRPTDTIINVPNRLDPSNILEENGRGLYLVQAVSESVYVNPNSITAKLKKQEVTNA